jgi:hypothetical protein
MAKPDFQAIAERLFSGFLGPLVVGGPLVPGKPIGGKSALGIGDRTPSDAGQLSTTTLARVRVARRIAPVDLFEPAPNATEWALAAVLHDLVQATHPGFEAMLRRSGPGRIVDVVERTLERIPPPETAGDALSRHTWLSRMLELARTDVEVSWWTGKETFLGTDPPARLLAWPEFRRVRETRTARPLMELPTSGAAVDAGRFSQAVQGVLAKTPLTDLSTVTRVAPGFQWSRENLTLLGTNAGRTMALRTLALHPERAVDAALGSATRALFEARALRAAMVALDLLRDRTLMTAETRLGGSDAPEPLAPGQDDNDAAFAVSAGALAASEWIARTGGGFAEAERKALLTILQPAASGRAAGAIRALLGG